MKSISALGTHMVAFRGEDGKVGVLDAFCPHLGAHLGVGGVVDGNLIVCPFHNWSFDAAGACQRIPYMDAQKGCEHSVPPKRTNTKAYVVREVLGLVLVWFHAEAELASRPEYEPEVAADLHEGVSKGDYYFAVMYSNEFDMHSCEMAMVGDLGHVTATATACLALVCLPSLF